MAIGKKLRFEVFKRDSFKCQYCGRSAPEVLLHVDHISPVSKGGEDDILNLVTSCADCNLGKSNRTLDDQSVLAKQKAQLDDLNERREQLEMMMEWSAGLREIKESVVDQLVEHWGSVAVGYRLNDMGIDALRKLVRKHPVNKIMDAMDVSGESYLKRGDDGQFTAESVNKAWSKLPGVLAVSSLPDAERQLYYIRGIVRNRLSYCNEIECMRLLKEGLKVGLNIDDLKDWAREARNWTDWRNEMYRIISEREGDE